MAYADIQIRADPQGAQGIAAQAFSTYGFRVTWENATKGKAEKGSKGGNIALGALAQYYAINFEIHPAQGGTVLRLIQGNSGMAGGIMGVAKVRKQFRGVSDNIADWMRANNMLVAYQKGK